MLLPRHMFVDQRDDAETLSGGGEGSDVTVRERADLQAA
jgi:hypothetical protein